jgi:hypothetical protein
MQLLSTENRCTENILPIMLHLKHYGTGHMATKLGRKAACPVWFPWKHKNICGQRINPWFCSLNTFCCNLSPTGSKFHFFPHCVCWSVPNTLNRTSGVLHSHNSRELHMNGFFEHLVVRINMIMMVNILSEWGTDRELLRLVSKLLSEILLGRDSVGHLPMP